MTELTISHYKPYFANRIISNFVIILKLTHSAARYNNGVIFQRERNFVFHPKVLHVLVQPTF